LAAEDSGKGEDDDCSRVSLTRRQEGQTQLVRKKMGVAGVAHHRGGEEVKRRRTRQ